MELTGFARICVVTLSMLNASGANAQFNRVHLDPTSGRVGYQLDVGYPIFHADDIPRGNKGGAVSGTCRADWFNPVYSGGLPPGMRLR